MVNVGKLIPKPNQLLGFLTSKELLIAGSAIIGVPLLLASAQNFISRIPFLKDHFTIAFLILGFMIASIGFGMSGIIRPILIGIGAGFAVGALTPQIRETISRVTGR